jgi:ATP-dependent protease ClpP protease subunit
VADNIEQDPTQNRSVVVWRSERVIFLNSQLSSIVAFHIEKAFSELRSENNASVYFIINSRGGDYYAALKIKSAIENSGLDVIIVVYGLALSGGMFLSQLCGNRLITAKSKLNFHMACHSFEKDVQFNAKELLAKAQELLTIDAMQLDVFTKRGRPIKEIFRLFREDALLGSRKAKKLKLVNEIIPEPKDLASLIFYLTFSGQ